MGGMGGTDDGTVGKNDVWSSTDGANWEQAPAAGWSARWDHTSLVFDNKMWVIGGLGAGQGFHNDVWSSTDGVTWTEVLPNNLVPDTTQWRGRGRLTSVVYGGKMWVMGGQDSSGLFRNDVWYSTDGVNWTEVLPNTDDDPTRWIKRREHTSLVFDNEMWVMGGSFTGSRIFSLQDVWHTIAP